MGLRTSEVRRVVINCISVRRDPPKMEHREFLTRGGHKNNKGMNK